MICAIVGKRFNIDSMYDGQSIVFWLNRCTGWVGVGVGRWSFSCSDQIELDSFRQTSAENIEDHFMHEINGN